MSKRLAILGTFFALMVFALFALNGSQTASADGPVATPTHDPIRASQGITYTKSVDAKIGILGGGGGGSSQVFNANMLWGTYPEWDMTSRVSKLYQYAAPQTDLYIEEYHINGTSSYTETVSPNFYQEMPYGADQFTPWTLQGFSMEKTKGSLYFLQEWWDTSCFPGPQVWISYIDNQVVVDIRNTTTSWQYVTYDFGGTWISLGIGETVRIISDQEWHHADIARQTSLPMNPCLAFSWEGNQFSPKASPTNTPTSTPTTQPVSSATATPTATATSTQTAKPSVTATATSTSSPSPTATQTSTPTATSTSTTQAASCPTIARSTLFTYPYGNVTIDGIPAPTGTIIEARNATGDTVGCQIVETAGIMKTMYVYGEQTVSGYHIPGMKQNEEVLFYVNGIHATATPTLLWTNDWSGHRVDISLPTSSPTTQTVVTPRQARSSLFVPMAQQRNGW